MEKALQLIKVTPALAEKWLNANIGNRPLVNSLVAKYEADMNAKRWTHCAMPIIFYDDGTLADGQKRLWAITLSKTTQYFYVWENYPRQAGLNIDTQQPRNVVDNARISGVDPNLNSQIVAYAKGIDLGVRAPPRPLTFAEIEDIVARHRSAAEWIVSHGPSGKGIRNSAVMAAIARALYHEKDRDRLQRFCQILGGGVPEGMPDSAALALRNYLMVNISVSHTGPGWRDTFLKAQNAVWYFMRAKQYTLVKKIGEERYPLPEPKKANGAHS